MADVVALIQLGHHAPSGLIVFEHEQTAALTQRSCSGQRHPTATLRKFVFTGSRVELE